MGNTTSKKPGINLRVSNPPNKNGNGSEWENFGNIFFNPAEARGTFYLKVSVEQLKKLIKGANKDGQVERKFGVRVSKPKDDAQGGGAPATPEVPQAAAA